MNRFSMLLMQLMNSNSLNGLLFIDLLKERLKYVLERVTKKRCSTDACMDAR